MASPYNWLSSQWRKFLIMYTDLTTGHDHNGTNSKTLAANSCDTSQIKAGALAASAAGRGKMADGFFDSATFGTKVSDSAIDRRKLALRTESTDNTAGALTITAAMVVNGLLTRDPNGASRTDVLPTAALLVAGITSPFVGQELEFMIVNMADAAETITVQAGSGGTMHPPASTIAQNTSKRYLFKLTNVTASSEAYDVFGMN